MIDAVDFELRVGISAPLPTSTNQYMQENILGEFIFARIHAEPAFALARKQENIFEKLFSKHFAEILGNSFQHEDMPPLYSHLRE